MTRQDIENYLHDKLVNNIITSRHTIRSYRTHLKAWLDFSKGLDSKEKAIEYRDYLSKSKDSIQIKTILYIINSFYKYLKLPTNPFEQIALDYKINVKEKNKKRVERDIRALTQDQVRAMIGHAYRVYHNQKDSGNFMKTYTAYRNYFIIKLLAEYGMRIGALVAINVSDIKLNDNLMMIYESKNKQPYPVPIIKLKNNIIEYLNFRAKIKAVDRDAFLLTYIGKRVSDTTVRTIVNEIASEVGFYEPQKSTHQLRHYRATAYYKEGMPIDLISMIMGVSPSVLKETYLHMTDADIVEQYELWLRNKNEANNGFFCCPQCGYQAGKTREFNKNDRLIKNNILQLRIV